MKKICRSAEIAKGEQVFSRLCNPYYILHSTELKLNRFSLVDQYHKAQRYAYLEPVKSVHLSMLNFELNCAHHISFTFVLLVWWDSYLSLSPRS